MDDEVEDYKLDTTFEREAGCILHTSWMQDRSRGLRKIRVEDRWHRKHEIGVGSFGTVYLEETIDGRQRAIKAIRKRLAEKFKVDHKRELVALTVLSRSKYLQHQTFVEFLGWFEDENHIFLAMEYIPYGDLSMYDEEIKENEAEVISQQLLEGLQIMHKKGFTHRDLKPQNIFVVQKIPSWWVKIGDFGISKRVTAADTTELRTEAGAIGYEAPEIRSLFNDPASQASSVYTNAVDIWSFGCVIYKIMTKKIPFPTSRDLRMFCDNRVSFPSLALEGKMGEEGIGFLKGILNPRPLLRPTAAQALHHSWLKLEEIPEEVVFNGAELRSSLPHASIIPHKVKEEEFIHFTDAIGRKFMFPFSLCRTWSGMEDLVRGAVQNVEISLHVAKGRYDLSGPNGEIILPQFWEMTVQPNWNIKMTLYPVFESEKSRVPSSALTRNGKEPLMEPIPTPRRRNFNYGTPTDDGFTQPLESNGTTINNGNVIPTVWNYLIPDDPQLDLLVQNMSSPMETDHTFSASEILSEVLIASPSKQPKRAAKDGKWPKKASGSTLKGEQSSGSKASKGELNLGSKASRRK